MTNLKPATSSLTIIPIIRFEFCKKLNVIYQFLSVLIAQNGDDDYNDDISI